MVRVCVCMDSLLCSLFRGKLVEIVTLATRIARVQQSIALVGDGMVLVECHNLVEVAVLARVATDRVHPLVVQVDRKMLDTTSPNDGEGVSIPDGERRRYASW